MPIGSGYSGYPQAAPQSDIQNAISGQLIDYGVTDPTLRALLARYASMMPPGASGMSRMSPFQPQPPSSPQPPSITQYLQQAAMGPSGTNQSQQYPSRPADANRWDSGQMFQGSPPSMWASAFNLPPYG